MPRPILTDLIDQGRGVTPADLVLRGGRVFDLRYDRGCVRKI